MILYFHHKLNELGITYHQFFEIAYFWRFQKQVQLHDDFAQFLLHSVLPLYVVAYLKHLQEKDHAQTRLDFGSAVCGSGGCVAESTATVSQASDHAADCP